MKIRFITLVFILIIFAGSKGAKGFLFWNQACVFSGAATSYIAIRNSPTLDITGSFTLETWISPSNSASPPAQVILEKISSANSNGYALYLINGRVAIRTNSSTRIIGKTILPNNSWSHIAGTFNSSTNLFTIHVNGSIDTSLVVTGAIPLSNPDSLKIGKGIHSPFSGIMDEIRIWQNFLNNSEISQYRKTSLGISTGIYDLLSLSLTFQNNESEGSDFSLFDWSNNNNNGVNNGIIPLDLSNRPSNTISPNECIELDGIDDHLAGQDNTGVSPVPAISIEAWIFPRSITGSRTIVQKGLPGPGTNYGLRLNGSILNAVINGNSSFNATIPVPLNLWTHVAFTYSGSTGKYEFYINGRKAGDGINMLGTIANGTDSLLVGSMGTSGSSYNGFIDEIRISNYQKSQAEINRFLYQSIDQANEPNPALMNVVYNLDGYSFSNSDIGPVLSFVSNARFSHSGSIDNQPVSPLNRADQVNYADGFSIKYSNRRIPETGTAGLLTDSLEVCMDTLISDLNLFVALNHTAEEELEMYLMAPNGEIVNFYMNNVLAPNADNIITVFDDQADSNINNNGRYVSYAPVIRPRNSLNSVFSGNKTGGTWRLVINDETGLGTGRLYAWGIQFNNISSRLSNLCLRVFMEGFYRPDDSCVVDTINVHLRESVAPHIDVGVAGETPDDNFIGRYTFPGAVFGTTYYLQVEHRNSIETWSANPISFDFLSGNLIYDFTVSQDTAFGSNQIQVDESPLRFAMYGGDVNQDDIVDASDLSLIDNDVFNGVTGYVDTDLTGDNAVDASDLSIADNNVFNSIEAITP